MTASIVAPSTALRSDQIEQYERDGYPIVRGVFSVIEMALAALEAERLMERRDLFYVDNIRCRWQPHVKTDECLFECFDPVIDIGTVCARVAEDRRILDILACLYGEPACLFKDKLIFKPSGAKGYDLHQDYISWPNFPTTFVTVLVPIDPAGRDNGCTEVFPGYHQQGYLSPRDGMYHALSAASVDESTGVLLELNPGDIAIFGCCTPHRSAPNRSERSRRQLYLSYNALSDGGPRREEHYREFHAWLKDRYAEYDKHNTYFA